MRIEIDILGGYSTGAQLARMIAYDQRDSTQRYLLQADITGLLLKSAILNFSPSQEEKTFNLIGNYLHDRADLESADPNCHGERGVSCIVYPQPIRVPGKSILD